MPRLGRVAERERQHARHGAADADLLVDALGRRRDAAGRRREHARRDLDAGPDVGQDPGLLQNDACV